MQKSDFFFFEPARSTASKYMETCRMTYPFLMNISRTKVQLFLSYDLQSLQFILLNLLWNVCFLWALTVLLMVICQNRRFVEWKREFVSQTQAVLYPWFKSTHPLWLSLSPMDVLGLSFVLRRLTLSTSKN